MRNRSVSLAILSSLLLCVGCEALPDKASEAREEKIYRTGSNIPVKDYGAANIEQRGAEIVNPINRPMAPVMNKKPGG